MTPEHLAKLPSGNIGVALGKVSGGLGVIDADTDEFADAFALSNPDLARTLQTHGARGRAFWFRFIGDYPSRTIKLKTASGVDLGEFRSNGSQSIIWETHPNCNDYSFIVRSPAMLIDFSVISWPALVANPPTSSSRECTEETEDTDATEDTEVIGSVSASGSVKTEEDALRLSAPSATHENNHKLFILARCIKALERGRAKYDRKDLLRVFNRWHEQNQFLDPAQTKEDYMIEFFNAHKRAKHPMGGDTIPNAWKAANSKPLPPEAGDFENPKMKLLIAFCYQLQLIAGSKPFYLSSRTRQRLLEQESHTPAAKWLGALCGFGVLVEVEKGNTKRAIRYGYPTAIK
jgi:hypothetical protein